MPLSASTATLLAGVMLFSVAGRAQEPLPPPVTVGLDSLTHGHCDGAMRVWTATWDAEKRQTMLHSCDDLNGLGVLHGYDLIATSAVGRSLLRVYIVLRYDPLPVYLLLVAYQPDKDWKITSVNWNTTADRVVPDGLLAPRRPS